MMEESSTVDSENLSVQKSEAPSCRRASSQGKRLFGLLIDLVLIILIFNTLDSLFRQEHWDLKQQARSWLDLTWFYGGVMLFLVFRDLPQNGSPGKRMLGMCLRKIDNLHERVPKDQLFKRNLSLFILPWEAWEIFQDPYGRRLGDRLAGTVVIDNPNAMRPMRRLLLSNLLFFGFFIIALGLQQPNMRKTSAFQVAYEVVSQDLRYLELQAVGLELEEPELHLDFREDVGDSRVRFRVNQDEKVQIFEVLLSLVKEPSPHWEFKGLKFQTLK
jgi:uncharacterized RDD family membrane protein YckC